VTLVRRLGLPEARALFGCAQLGPRPHHGADHTTPIHSARSFPESVALPPSITLLLSPTQLQRLLPTGRLPRCPVSTVRWSRDDAVLAIFSDFALPPLLYTVYFFTANAVLLGVGSVVLASSTVFGQPHRSCSFSGPPSARACDRHSGHHPPATHVSPVMLVCPLLFIPALIGRALVAPGLRPCQRRLTLRSSR